MAMASRPKRSSIQNSALRSRELLSSCVAAVLRDQQLVGRQSATSRINSDKNAGRRLSICFSDRPGRVGVGSTQDETEIPPTAGALSPILNWPASRWELTPELPHGNVSRFKNRLWHSNFIANDPFHTFLVASPLWS